MMTNTTPTATNWNQQYRPRRVQDLHLNSVREALQHLMKAPHFPQTLLFAGPKGTGKTSVARIIGAILNDPANDQAVKERFFAHDGTAATPLVEADSTSALSQGIFIGQSYVVQEQDAASNRGIDDIRALKERSALPPVQGQITVYILDEVHMLTIEAFNALLKLLEEPPAHTVFILATTELHKIPATIASRCHLIRFHKATAAELAVPLKAIIVDQKLTIKDDVINLIATLADGSFRDAVKLLQQFVQQGSSAAALAHLTETLSEADFSGLIQAVIDADSESVVQKLETVRQQGVDEQYFIQSLITFLHRDVLKALAVAPGDAFFDEKISRFFLQQLAQPDIAKPSPIPFLRLELALLELIDRSKAKRGSNTPPTKKHAAPTAARVGQQTDVAPATVQPLHQADAVVLIEPAAYTDPLEVVDAALGEKSLSSTLVKTETVNGTLGDGRALCEKWQELVSKATKYNFAFAALLRSAQPIGGSEGEVVVRVFYTFHKEQLLQHKWRPFWDELMMELAGGFIRLDCVVEKINPNDLQPSSPLVPGVSLEALAVDALMH